MRFVSLCPCVCVSVSMSVPLGLEVVRMEGGV